jgi:hypothetical protein
LINTALQQSRLFDSESDLTSGVDFINVIGTIFLYKYRFGSFFYIQVTRKKAAKTTIVQRICLYNVDEIASCRYELTHPASACIFRIAVRFEELNLLANIQGK